MRKSFHLSVYFFALMITFSGCNESQFKLDENVTSLFHVMHQDYPIPVMVRGNTSSGIILLFVQGGPGLNSLDFAEIDYPDWKNTLEKEYAVAYYDQRGVGNGQGDYDNSSITLETWVEDLHQVALFLEKAYNSEIVMLGHSFGGRLIYQYIIEHNDDAIPTKYISVNGTATSGRDSLRWAFRREFLLNTAILEIKRNNNDAGWQEVVKWLNVTPVIEDVEGDNPRRDKDQWNAYVNTLIYPYYPKGKLSVMDVFNALFSSPYNPIEAYLDPRLNDEAIKRIFEGIYNYKLITKLPEITQEILLITGRYDDICPPVEMKYIYEQISSPRKQLEILDSAGHDLFIQQKELLNNLVTDFIQ